MTRKPDEIPSDIMQPLETLPVFYPLAGKRVVVVGDGEGAAWKVDLAAATGARVDVFARDACDKLREVVAGRDNATLYERAVTAADFEGATLAFAATFDDAEADAARKAADAAGVALNLADRPAMSDFIMGAIVNRSPLVIGVSTGGASPVFAQAVRGRIESLAPSSFAAWAKAAQDWRPQNSLLRSGFSGAAGFLAPLHAPRLPRHRARATGKRSRRTARRGEGGQRRDATGSRDAGRLGTGRSGIIDAQGHARAGGS